MATGAEVLSMLIPTGGWAILGDDFDSIQFIEATAITKDEFQAGFTTYDAHKEAKELEAAAVKAAARQVILDRLGITVEEAALLLG